MLEFGPYRVDRPRRVAWRGDELLPLAPKAVEILAIGSPQGLRAALERPGGYLAFLEQYIDARVTITTSQDISVPATQRDLTPTAARAVE